MEINRELGNELVALAKEMGAIDAKIFTMDEVCFDSRVILKCLYGLGIDVYQTVRNVGWEIEVVQKKGDPRKNFTAVFVE